MDTKRYLRIRFAVALFVAAVMVIAVVRNSYLLLIGSVLTGILFIGLLRSQGKMRVDEREKSVREKAAKTTYNIFAPTIGIGACLLLAVGSRFPYLEALGTVLAYLTLFLIAVYAICYFFINRRYGGGEDE